MIRYALKCSADHAFESWFQSAAAFDGLLGSGHLTCPVCNSTQITKGMMAPAVKPARKAAIAPSEPGKKPHGPLSTPANRQEEALTALRREVEANSEYVGGSFALEARAIHEGTSPERAIHGEAKLEDARKLIEDGVPVLPLPFRPIRKTN